MMLYQFAEKSVIFIFNQIIKTDTGTNKYFLNSRQIAQFDIQHYFATLLGLDDIYAGSKEDIGRQYLRRCGIAPEETCMIGDTLHDADVARAIGAHCVLVARGHQSRETLLTSGYPVVNTLEEAAELVERM